MPHVCGSIIMYVTGLHLQVLCQLEFAYHTVFYHAKVCHGYPGPGIICEGFDKEIDYFNFGGIAFSWTTQMESLRTCAQPSI